MPNDRQELIDLYAEMAAHTKPECQQCFRPYSCCDALSCEIAIKVAEKFWNVKLEKTGHPTLPLMGPTGCTAAPHLRPACSMHTCQVNGLGSKPGDKPWTEKYYRLRTRIEQLESEIM